MYIDRMNINCIVNSVDYSVLYMYYDFGILNLLILMNELISVL